MEKKLRITFVALFLAAAPLLTLAQQPPHPNAGENPGIGNGPVGGGAPISNGTLLLLGLAGLYGMKRVCSIKQNTYAE
jgi:hypothetical protein